jgi:adenylate cyclase
MLDMKIDVEKNRVYVTDHLVLIGFSLGVFYWVFDAFFSIFLAKEGLNPFQLFFTPAANPGWTRLVVLCLFILFGAHAQFALNERRKAAKKMQQEASTRERFERLLSPDLAELVVSGELEVKKGGEIRYATVMFADVRGFTKMSEYTDAEELLKLLNEYFEIIVDVVFHHGGTVDKFIGDEIMVIWGAPVAHGDDPIRAVRAALEIQFEMAKFNLLRNDKNLPQVELGIALNTGNLVAGYIGSSRTMSYSVIGDIVNVAHGICPAAKANQIIISENTYNEVKDFFEVTELQPVYAKGKLEPVSVYGVVGEKGGTDH